MYIYLYIIDLYIYRLYMVIYMAMFVFDCAKIEKSTEQ